MKVVKPSSLFSIKFIWSIKPDLDFCRKSMSSFFIVTRNSPQPYAVTFYTIRVAASCVDPTWGACQVTENVTE